MILTISVLCLIASCVVAYSLLTVRNDDLAHVQSQFHTEQERIAADEQQIRDETTARMTELDRRRDAFCMYLATRTTDPQVAKAATVLAHTLGCPK